MTSVDAYVSKLFEHLILIKVAHFQVKSGFVHTKLDTYMTAFLASFDRFFEVWQGTTGARLGVRKVKVDLNFTSPDDRSYNRRLNDSIGEFVNFIETNEPLEGGLSQPLAAIRDDMVAEAVKLRYLLTFE